MNVKIRINDVAVLAAPGERLLDVALRAGFDIPHLCHHPATEASASCRLCLVELKHQGKEMLTTSCNVAVEDGMELITDSATIRKQRAMNLELLLARAPGAPRLRQLALAHGIAIPRFAQVSTASLPNCILCDLCVRVCAGLGHNALSVLGRGDKKRVGLPYNQPAATCVGCGSCASVCPTQCIPVKDSPRERTIWGQSFPFVLCSQCQKPVLTQAHRDHAMTRLGTKENYDVCESCKQIATGRRFAAVTW